MYFQHPILKILQLYRLVKCRLSAILRRRTCWTFLALLAGKNQDSDLFFPSPHHLLPTQLRIQDVSWGQFFGETSSTTAQPGLRQPSCHTQAARARKLWVTANCLDQNVLLTSGYSKRRENSLEGFFLQSKVLLNISRPRVLWCRRETSENTFSLEHQHTVI